MDRPGAERRNSGRQSRAASENPSARGAGDEGRIDAFCDQVQRRLGDDGDVRSLFELWARGYRLRADREVRRCRNQDAFSFQPDLPAGDSGEPQDPLARAQGAASRLLAVRLREAESRRSAEREVLLLAESLEAQLRDLNDDGPGLLVRTCVLEDQLAELVQLLRGVDSFKAPPPYHDLLRRIERTRATFEDEWESRSSLATLDEQVRRRVLDRCREEHEDRDRTGEWTLELRLGYRSRVNRVLLHNLGELSFDDEVLLGVTRCLGQDETQIGRQLAELPPEEATRLIIPWEENLRDRVEEELARAMKRSSERCAFTLSLLERELETHRLALRRHLRVLSSVRLGQRKKKQKAETGEQGLRGERQALKRRLRSLNRLRRRIRAEAQDRQVRGRIEGLLGRRGANWLDGLMLFLIVAVCSLLVVETGFDLSPRQQTIFQIADAVICFFFLGEFFFKLGLARRKGLYFLRHLFTEFLPSIPFLIYARPIRALRLARLTRLARAIRLLVFALRGFDRITTRLSALLHWNIVFFEPPSSRSVDSGSDDRADRLARLRLRTSARIRIAGKNLPADERRCFLAWREDRYREQLSLLEKLDPPFVSSEAERDSRLDGPLGNLAPSAGDDSELRIGVPGLNPNSTSGGAFPSRDREIRFEQVIGKLVKLDPVEVEEVLGPEMCGKVAQVVGALNQPLLRHLPLLSPIARAVRDDALATTVEAGKALGRILEKGYSIVTWFSDLHGVVTGPQFVDRVGTGLAASSRRPAVRLLLLGALFGVTKVVVDVLNVQSPLLNSVVGFLAKSLGFAIVVLGVVCLGIHLLGLWLRRLAGEATEVYEKTAEAQYINLLKAHKRRRRRRDLQLLWYRVVSHEPSVGRWALFDGERVGGDDDREEIPGDIFALRDRISLLYEDYLDGAVLHRSDTKTTEQLLGNATLENIRQARFRLGRKERKRIRKLDLARERSFGGPYFWFRSMFTALQQQTAKLLMDYNRSCVPLDQLEKASPEVEARHRAFLSREGSESRRATDRERRSFLQFVTTDFNALNFLTFDRERDEFIGVRFGEGVLGRLCSDRRRMIRRVFGTYPFHARKRRDRVVNAFEIYLAYLRGGRFLFLPLWVFLLALRGLAWILKQMGRMVGDLLDPQRTGSGATAFAEASFEVARRKINRMRKPVFMECVRFRARFDPEYLGAPAPGSRGIAEGEGNCDDDLNFIGARVAEREEIEVRGEVAEELSVSFLRVLGELNWQGEELEIRLEGIGADLPGRKEEVLRALWIAFFIDFRQLRTLLTLPGEIRSEFEEVVFRQPERSLSAVTPGRGGRALRRGWALVRWRRARLLRTAFHRYWDQSPFASLPEEDRHACLHRCLQDPAGLGRQIRALHLAGGLSRAREKSEEILEAVASGHVSWTRQLVTLRMVHAMAILDVANDRSIVYELGGYADECSEHPDRSLALVGGGPPEKGAIG